MPIEFQCVQCQKLLRMSDESAGAKARCPQCQAISVVPAASQASPPPSPPPAPEANPFSQNVAPPGINPYSTPTHAPAKQKLGSGNGQPTAVTAGDVISYAWEVWKNHLGILLGVTLLIFGINFGVSMVQQVAIIFFQQQGSPEIGLILQMVVGLIGNAVQLFLGIGQTKIILKLLRGQHADFGEVFSGGKLFFPTLGASIVAGLAMLLGFVLLIVPGILLILFFWPFYHLIVDEKARAMESFSAAMPIAKLNVGTAFVLWLASIGIMILGFVALCVGILFAAPLVSTMWATAYLMMSGQIGTRPMR